MIEPIQRSKLYEDVARRITEMVRDGEWLPGERIPTENALAERFEVGRSTVREAVKSLQIAGVLRSRTGKGTFVAENACSMIRSTELVKLLENGAEIADLVETRIAIEPAMAALAAQRCDGGGTILLQEILAAMERCETKSELLEEGHRFHSAVAEAAVHSHA